MSRAFPAVPYFCPRQILFWTAPRSPFLFRISASRRDPGGWFSTAPEPFASCFGPRKKRPRWLVWFHPRQGFEPDPPAVAACSLSRTPPPWQPAASTHAGQWEWPGGGARAQGRGGVTGSAPSSPGRLHQPSHDVSLLQVPPPPASL